MYKAEGGWIRCTSPAAADPEFEAVTERRFGGNEKRERCVKEWLTDTVLHCHSTDLSPPPLVLGNTLATAGPDGLFGECRPIPIQFTFAH
ncbi:hypothetical protein SRHO_G00138970 [Serrasalmus rhombeus]